MKEREQKQNRYVGRIGKDSETKLNKNIFYTMERNENQTKIQITVFSKLQKLQTIDKEPIYLNGQNINYKNRNRYLCIEGFTLFNNNNRKSIAIKWRREENRKTKTILNRKKVNQNNRKLCLNRRDVILTGFF